MKFNQYYLQCLSHASYLIGDESSGRAVVVDPQRDVSEYLVDAADAGLTIELVVETPPISCRATSSWPTRPAPASPTRRWPSRSSRFGAWPTVSGTRSAR
jgi:hypothetical protein